MRSLPRWIAVVAIALSTGFLVGVPTTLGAPIDWLPPIENADNLPVNNGNVIEAVNAAGPEVVINGITFLDGDFGGDIVHSDLVTTSDFDSCCSDNGGPPGASPNMEIMLNSHRWASGPSRVATLHLQGLTVGSDYQIQLYFSDVRGAGDHPKEYVWAGEEASISAVFNRNGPDPDNVSFLGTFTADAELQKIMAIPLGTNIDGFQNHDPGISGYVLSLIPGAGDATPEPASVVLVAVAAVGSLAFTRRRRQPAADRPSLLSLIAIGSACTIGTLGASAAPMGWIPPIDNLTNLPINNGNVIEAVNAAGPEVVINGITFLEGDFGGDIVHSNLVTDSDFDNCCSDNGGPSGVDASMETMLDSHRWASNGPAVATLRLEGLTVGKTYSIQTYFTDVRGVNDHPKTYFWMDDHGNASQTWTRNGETPDNVSFFATFTADNELQNMHMVSNGRDIDGFVNHDPGLSGYVLSEIVLTADFDKDDDVDGDDFLIWQSNFGTMEGATSNTGDTDGDGDVDGDDFLGWQQEFGSGGGGQGGSSIPEPASALLICIGIAGLATTIRPAFAR